MPPPDPGVPAKQLFAAGGGPPRPDSLAAWLRWQERLHPQAIALGLERVRAVAAPLGLPVAGIRTATVAGTNGKGSSATLLADIYRRAGYRVGLYTSPHLLRYNERVAVDGRAATDAELCAAFAAVEAARGDVALTYFEFGTLAALWHFRERGVGVQVLEVGLGGRLDAVNLVDADGVLITSIGLDHCELLGPDLASIGFEKAGVMRPGRAAVVAQADAPASVRAHAESIGARLHARGRDFEAREREDSWDWRGLGRDYRALPRPGLPGRAQIDNAAGVLALATALQDLLPVSETAIRQALPALHLPARHQRLGNVVLDVAHNVEAVQVLAENLGDKPHGRRRRCVLGMLKDKPVEKIGAVLAPHVDRFLLCGLPPPRGLRAEELAARLAGVAVPYDTLPDPAAAFAAAKRSSGPADEIVVCGSFLTVAAVMEAMRE